MSPTWSFLVGLVLFSQSAPLFAGSVFSFPQDENQPKWKEDPYTENEPEQWKAAGYTDYGRFLWAGDHGTTEIEKTLGAVQIVWVETKHFQIGCSLPPYKLPPDKKQREKINEELDRLREKFPSIPKKVRRMDRWLRCHLYAQRLEETWEEFTKILGVDDSSFPTGPGNLVNGKFMGQGPYLGQKSKFTVMLLQKESTLGRYCKRFAPGYTHGGTKTHNFFASGSLFYGTCTELAEGYLADDSKLHCNVVSGVIHNLTNGLKGYTHKLPLWMEEGLAHWFVERVDERYHMFSKTKETFPNEKKLWKWRPRIRKLAKFGVEAYPSGKRLFTWKNLDGLSIAHHMMFWSKVDYLLQKDPQQFGEFLLAMSDPIFKPGEAPHIDKVINTQETVFPRVFGVDFDGFEAAWNEWVLDEYPTK